MQEEFQAGKTALRSPAEGEGNEGFPPPSEKDLESPSSIKMGLDAKNACKKFSV